MAQSGDTITYTYSDGTSESEDVSTVDEITVDYLDGAGGEVNNGAGAGSGGRVENVTIDVSNLSTLYLWVASQPEGRYYSSGSISGGGSTEISDVNTNDLDSTDEPLLVGAGGGGGDSATRFTGGGGGERGGSGGSGSPADGDGVAPPLGGDGADEVNSGVSATDGEGYVNTGDSRVSGGSTITGGGAGAGTDGEIQITYDALSAPTNVAITDAQTGGELTVDWDTVSGASGYYVYRAESSGSAKSDYTQVANVSGPPYTDTDLEDGERYYYRVSAYN